MTPLHRAVVTDPVDKSAVTVQVWHDGRRAYASVGVGPGIGPHVTTSPHSFREWADALNHAADVFDAAAADLQALETEQGEMQLWKD